MDKKIYALHGFLGTSTDWERFNFNTFLIAPNLFYSKKMLNFSEFASNFNKNIVDNDQENILLGYSMGGRLALHSLIDSPDNWKAAIIVSAHPGLNTENEKQERLTNDKKWLQKFQTENFDTVMSEWNAQLNFNKDKPLNLRQGDYTNQMLEQCLDSWSLGLQDDLNEAISKLRMPILWIVGEKDLKFTDLALKLTFSNPKSRVWIAKNCSHRVAWESVEFEKQVNLFLEGL